MLGWNLEVEQLCIYLEVLLSVINENEQDDEVKLLLASNTIITVLVLLHFSKKHFDTQYYKQ
jgi:hypothetical protein